MRTIAQSREKDMSMRALGALLVVGARFSEFIAHSAKSTFPPKVDYHDKSHEANQHAQYCLVRGMGQLAAKRV